MERKRIGCPPGGMAMEKFWDAFFVALASGMVTVAILAVIGTAVAVVLICLEQDGWPFGKSGIPK
jgi:hypothetical protein